MKLICVYLKAVVEFLVKDEVDREKALEERKSWLESELTIYKGDAEITFKWITYRCVKDEIYDFLRRLGVRWDREEVKENSLGYKVVALYDGNVRVATITYDEAGFVRGLEC